MQFFPDALFLFCFVFTFTIEVLSPVTFYVKLADPANVIFPLGIQKYSLRPTLRPTKHSVVPNADKSLVKNMGREIKVSSLRFFRAMCVCITLI